MEAAANVGRRVPRGKRRTDKTHRHELCLKQIETVMHYIRKVAGIPSRAPQHDNGSDPLAAVAWRCVSCSTLVPRSQVPLDTCPNCGARRVP